MMSSLFFAGKEEMDIGATSTRAISIEDLKTLKLQESWLPVTPAKPIPALPTLGTQNWFDAGGIRLPAQFVQATTSASDQSSQFRHPGFSNTETATATAEPTGNRLWNSLTYAHLSGLANAASGAPAAASTGEQRNSNGDVPSRPSFAFSVPGNMLESNSANMVMEYMYSNGLNQSSQPRYGFPVTYTPALTAMYHPNSHPTTVAIADAVPAGSIPLQTTSNMHRETSTYRHCPPEIGSGAQDNHLCSGGMANENLSSQFAPSTPQKQRQQYEFVNDMGGETLNQEENRVGCMEKSSQVGLSDVDLSTPLKRNQDRDKLYSPIKENHQHQTEEEEDRIDLNRTPRLKPRRKKHRPRVITENKPRAPKTTDMKNMKDPKTVKRKYVRRVTSNSSTPLADVAGQTKEANRCIVTRSCKRSLNFDQESQTRECPGKIPTQQEKETSQIDNTLNVARHLGGTSTQMVGEHVPLPESATLPTRRQLLRKNLEILGKNDHEHNATEDCQSIGWKHSQPIDGRLWSSKQLDVHAPSNFETVREGMRRDFKRTRSGEGKLFPHIPKKRRTMSTARNLLGATTADSQRKVIQYCRKNLTTSQWNKANSGKMMCSELVMSIRQTKIKTRKRTKSRTRVRNFAILTSIARYNLNMKKARNGRKRSNDNSFSSTKETREQNLVMYSRRHYSVKPRGNLKDVQFKSPIEDLIERLNRLSISGANRLPSLNEQTALVPFKGDDRLVIYGSKLDLMKKMRPRAKVELDPETERMWNVLMRIEPSEAAEGTDAEKEKWWEEERRVFHGRVDSFISRMHLIQGDRRFSKWNGSVLDSVIGVFLTQNVSDHLSSSAFITLAAKFPLERTRNDKMGHAEETRMYVEEPEIEVIQSDNVSWHENRTSGPVISQDSQGSVILNEADCIEEKEMGRKTEVESNGVSPQNSVKSSLFQVTEFSSKDPANSSINKKGEIVRSYSDSNSEEEDPSTRCIPNGSSSCTSFMELLQTSIFQECYNSANECLSIDLNSNIPETGSDEWSYLNTINARSSVLPYSSIGTSTTGILHTPSKNIMSNSCFPATPNTEFIGVQCPEIGSSEGAREITELSTPLDTQATTIDLHCSSLNKQPVHPNTSLEQEFGLERQLNSWGKSVLEIDQTCLDEGNQSSKPENDALSRKGDSKKQQQIGSNSSKSGEAVDVETPMLLDKSYSRRTGYAESVTKEQVYSSGLSNEKTVTASKPNGKKPKEKKKVIDWDYLRKEAYEKYGKRERNSDTMDSLDWEAVRRADVNVLADCIKARGMNNMLAARIKNFLNRLAREHEEVDLEWLRDVPPDKVKEYLLSVKGLGLKSVECIRLLTLHHLAFPVDTNVGRIVVRLGWVPLQPLPESLQLHLLEMYPVQANIQKYLWPRLCKLDQRTLYELHYQLITFGKVFCTKSKPNCNACPMRAECKHFASAFASTRLLPAPEEKRIVSSTVPPIPHKSGTVTINPTLALLPLKIDDVNSAVPNHDTEVSTNTMLPPLEINMQSETGTVISNSEPIIEVPTTPEPECNEMLGSDIEDAFWGDPDEIPLVDISGEKLFLNLQNYMKENNIELQDVDIPKYLVALTPEAASIPTPKLKNVGRLRTEHQVYELPDSHPLLEGVEKRVPSEVCSYLLAIWTPGETAESTQPPQRCCDSQMSGNDLCTEKTCFSCNSMREANSQTVRGTLLIPCKTAMRGSFPLNGTYFQVNEVFADHDSSLNPIDVPRAWLWNLPRRTVYFGTSISTIFRGQSMEQIQSCFWRGYVCVRGFDRKTRAPRPLMARLHFPASRMMAARGKEKSNRRE